MFVTAIVSSVCVIVTSIVVGHSFSSVTTTVYIPALKLIKSPGLSGLGSWLSVVIVISCPSSVTADQS